MNSFIELRNAKLLELGISYFASTNTLSGSLESRNRAPHIRVQPPPYAVADIVMENGCVVFNPKFKFEGNLYPLVIRNLINAEYTSGEEEEVIHFEEVRVFVFANSHIADIDRIWQYTRCKWSGGKTGTPKIFPNLKGIKCGEIELKNNDDLAIFTDIVKSLSFFWCGSISCSITEPTVIKFENLQILQILCDRLISNVQLDLPKCELIWIDSCRSVPRKIAQSDNVLSIIPNEVNTHLKLDYFVFHAMQRLKLVGFKFIKTLKICYDDDYREFDEYFEQLFTELEGLENLEIVSYYGTTTEFDMIFQIVRTKLNLKTITLYFGRERIKFIPLNDNNHMKVVHSEYEDASFISQCDAACTDRNEEIDRQNAKTLSSIKAGPTGKKKSIADPTITQILKHKILGNSSS
jgi:hypothetical protein